MSNPAFERDASTAGCVNLNVRHEKENVMNGRMNYIALLAIAITCCVSSLGECTEYENAWVKYADDKTTSYSIDTNSIMRNNSGNYYVLTMTVPYKDNVFNKRLNRSDIAHVYTENEIDIAKNLIRVLSFRAYDKKGREVLNDSYANTGDVPPFKNIVEGSVTDSLKIYVVKHLKANGQERR